MSAPGIPRGDEELRSLLAAIVESSDDAIISKDLDGIITSWSQGATRLYGYSADEAIGRPISMLVPDDRADEIQGIMDRLRRGERVDHYETVRVTKDGRRLDISLTVSPIVDGEGQVIGASAVGRDVTGRKRTERAIAQELRGYRRLQEVSSRVISAGDVQTLYQELVAAAIDITEADRGTMQSLDQETGELRLLETVGFPREARDRFSRVTPESCTSCALTLKSGERVVVDYDTDDRVAGTADARAHLELGIRTAQSTPLLTRDGRLMGMLSTHWDREHRITENQTSLLDLLARQAADLIERTEAEERLRASEARERVRSEQFETLVDRAPMGVYFVDADLRIQEVNPAAEPVFADFPGGAIGHDFEEVLEEIWGAEQGQDLLDIVRRTLETGEPYHQPEFAGRRADLGITEYYDWRVERILLPDGRYGVVCYFTEVSDQVNARLAIAESEDRYRTLFRSIGEGFCLLEVLLDAEGRPEDYRFLEVNPAFERHTGLVGAEGETALELVPELEPRWIEMYGRVALTGEPERSVDRSEAMGRWFDVEAFRVGRPEDRRVGLLFTDVTEARRAAEEIRASEQRERERANELSALMDSVPAAVLMAHDPEARRITGSRKAHELLRIPPDGNFSLSARGGAGHLRILQDGEEVPPKELPVERAARGEAVDGEELEIRFDDGSVKYLFGNAIPIHDDEGRPRGSLAAMIDITDRKQAEQALRRSEERLRLAKAAAELGIHDYQVATGTIRWDPRTREIWGVGPDEPITYDLWLSGIHPDDRESTEAAVNRGTEPGGDGVYFAEYRVVNRRDGSIRWIEATGQTAFVDGKPVRLVGTVQDITAEKRAQEALKEADRRKDEFLATLAHELRNPLGAIRTAMSAMRTGRDDPALVDRMSDVIERQSSHLIRLIDDLMDVSRISVGKVKLELQRMDLADVVRQVVDDSRHLFEKKGVGFQVTLPEKPIMVEVDPVRFAQVVNNLRHNALKFTPEGGRVRLSLEREGEEAIVRMTDTGVGMTPEQISTVFEMFTQFDASHAGETDGLGIGLSLAKTIIDLHGGAIEARSEGPRMGSEFAVRLPVSEVEARSVPDTDEDGGPPVPGTEEPTGRRIVLAEDNEDARYVVALLLRTKGHEVETAEDGLQALEKIRDHRPDVALLDIGMPRMDGYEVARAIRQEPWGGEMFLVAMTGWGREADKHAASEAGFDLHLTKPVDIEDLQGILQARLV